MKPPPGGLLPSPPRTTAAARAPGILHRLDRAIFGRFYERYHRSLEREVLDGGCGTLLDIGCGSSSPVGLFSSHLSRCVGVDPFEPSIAASRERGLHHEYHLMEAVRVDVVPDGMGLPAAVRQGCRGLGRSI